MDELAPYLPPGRWYKLRCFVDGFPVLYARTDSGIKKFIVVRRVGKIELLEQRTTSRLKCC
jgi:hypothetical protein